MFVACAFGDASVDYGSGVGIFVFHMHGGNFCDYVVVVVVAAAQLKFKFSLFPTKNKKQKEMRNTNNIRKGFRLNKQPESWLVYSQAYSHPHGPPLSNKMGIYCTILYIHDSNYRHKIKGAMPQIYISIIYLQFPYQFDSIPVPIPISISIPIPNSISIHFAGLSFTFPISWISFVFISF